MNIQQVNNTSFNGSYKLKGKWTKGMVSAATPFLEKLAEGDKEIIAKMSTKPAFDRYHRFGQRVYKLTLISKEENRTLLQKIKDIFKRNEMVTDVSEIYHRASSTERLLKERLNLQDYNIHNFLYKLDINMPKK